MNTLTERLGELSFHVEELERRIAPDVIVKITVVDGQITKVEVM